MDQTRHFPPAASSSSVSCGDADPMDEVVEIETTLSVKKDVFVWVIEGWSLLPRRFREGTSSPTVGMLGHAWGLRVYPGGSSVSEESAIGLFLHYHGQHPEVLTDCDMIIKCQTGNDDIKLTMSTIKFGNTAKQDGQVHQSHGWGNFAKRERLEEEANGFIVNNKMIIECHLKVRSSRHSVVDNPNHVGVSLSTDLSALLQSQELTDVQIHIHYGEERQTFSAHKAILAARSPVLQAMFSTEMEEATSSSVTITDVPPFTFDALLRYLYTNKLRQNDGVAPTASDLIPLHVLADKYQVTSLVQDCETTMGDVLSPTNCIEILDFADSHDVEELKSRALLYVTDHANEVFTSEGWEWLKRSGKSQLIGDVLETANMPRVVTQQQP